MSTSVTVCIPHLPDRVRELARAVSSVAAQTRQPQAISVATDLHHRGAWDTRTRAVRAAQTDWVALLDDDDFLHPQHLAVLFGEALKHPEVDYWYSWFDVVGGTDPLGYLGREFDPCRPHQTTTTILVKTRLAQKVGWHAPVPGAVVDGQRCGEDFVFTLDCLAAGAEIRHVPQITWSWVHHANTSGMPR